MNKYKNIKTTIHGIKFDSKKESKYYLYFKQLEKEGKIKDLELQKEFILLDSFKLNGKSYRKTSYFADFTFKTTQGDKLHVVDIKSPITRKNGVYKLKKKLLANRYGIEIEEM